ncbi:DUF4959 domain-containing protein [Niabella drilacis]|uniref:DUF4959 domain-containing protein n=1 Tax=Niabella drilacis (strain DSM 25811 / CCM 8410 / CCUG 62505 / LMG 26954 / E90) TaxID=1285928 RepID=A0A1G7BJN4_NIADE|nr:DUF4959 domain-containing protein [Niabella drilacis]SDE27137.1 protein of unknown function [Niabella drilacis]
MKYLVFILMYALTVSGIASCRKSDDNRAPLFTSNTKPLPVTDVKVTNVAGGAIITYKLPKDPSILYVQADYVVNDKVKRQEKVSFYADTILVNGFAREDAYKITLRSVTESEIKSDPVEVQVNPLTPPYRSIAATIAMQDAFSGVNITCQNPEEAEVGIGLVVDTTGRPGLVYTEYTKAIPVNFSVRGFAPRPYRMGAYVVDRWGNISDTVWNTITPLYETLLNRNIMTNAKLPQDMATLWGASKTLEQVLTYTGATAGFYGGFGKMTTIYLGKPAKLSRFKFYQTTDGGLYNFANLKVFQVWASMNPGPTGALNDGTWTQLGTYEIIKPSGKVLGQNTQEDIDAANAGHSFDFPSPVVQAKYVRIVTVDTWAVENDNRLRIGTIYFWGDAD